MKFGKEMKLTALVSNFVQSTQANEFVSAAIALLKKLECGQN